MVLVSFIDPPMTLAMHSIPVIRPGQIIADAGIASDEGALTTESPPLSCVFSHGQSPHRCG
jgi:hypothetical protein